MKCDNSARITTFKRERACVETVDIDENYCTMLSTEMKVLFLTTLNEFKTDLQQKFQNASDGKKHNDDT